MCAISTLIVVSETRTVGIKSMSYHGLMIYNKLKFVTDSYKNQSQYYSACIDFR